MGAWFPNLGGFDPFAGVTNGITDLIKLGLVVVVLLILGLALLSGKLNTSIPPPWSTGLGVACLAAAFYLLYRGGF